MIILKLKYYYCTSTKICTGKEFIALASTTKDGIKVIRFFKEVRIMQEPMNSAGDILLGDNQYKKEKRPKDEVIILYCL